jgi:fatty acid desaturase
VSAVRKLDSSAPQGARPDPSAPRRHLELVPPRSPAADEARRVRESRWVAALLVVATGVLFGLFTAAMLGATDAAWWPVVLGVALAGIAVLGGVVVRKTH